MISFNQDIATALDRAIVKITDKFLEPPIMITISNSDSVIGTLVENIKSLDPLLYSKLTHQKNIRIK